MNDYVFRPCPICRTGLVPDEVPVRMWNGKEWHVFFCPKNCKSEIWVVAFAGIKKKQNGKPFWPFGRR